MSAIVGAIVIARLIYWLYKYYSDRAYARKWHGTPDGAPVPRQPTLPPRPVIAPEHLVPEGRET